MKEYQQHYLQRIIVKIIEQVNDIYEATRQILINTESITERIKKITNKKLKEKLLENLRTCQADILLLNELLIEVINCSGDDDIEFMVENNSSIEGING